MWLIDYLKKRQENRQVTEEMIIKKEEPFTLNACEVCTEQERCSKLYKEALHSIRETTMCNVWFKAVMENRVALLPSSE